MNFHERALKLIKTYNLDYEKIEIGDAGNCCLVYPSMSNQIWHLRLYKNHAEFWIETDPKYWLPTQGIPIFKRTNRFLKKIDTFSDLGKVLDDILFITNAYKLIRNPDAKK